MKKSTASNESGRGGRREIERVGRGRRRSEKRRERREIRRERREMRKSEGWRS